MENFPPEISSGGTDGKDFAQGGKQSVAAKGELV